jgi:hypothetical protein
MYHCWQILCITAGKYFVVRSKVYLVMPSMGTFWCIMGALRNPSAPIPHNSLHSSPFYLKGPRTAATEKPPETRGHPGCNDKSKNHPRAHKRRIKPPQALSFRYPWDSVSRSHKTSKLCMLHTRPCGTTYIHNAPTIYSDIP